MYIELAAASLAAYGITRIIDDGLKYVERRKQRRIQARDARITGDLLRKLECHPLALPVIITVAMQDAGVMVHKDTLFPWCAQHIGLLEAAKKKMERC